MRIFLLVSLFVCSCSGESVPKGVLPPEKMEAVLYDLIRADELVDFSIIQDSSYRNFSKRSSFYDSISHIHGLTKEALQKSWLYYQGRPDLLKKILESLHAKTDTATLQKDSILKKPTTKEIVKPQ